ncbi:MAG: TlpA disulfide reductase family protein [Gemmatimonas sp.]
MSDHFVLARRTIVRAMVVTVAVTATSTPLVAQGNSASTPQACISSVNGWRTAQISPALTAYRAATDANRAELQTKYVDAVNASAKDAQKKAAECAAKFAVGSVNSSQLSDLVALLTMAQDTANVRVATDRLLNDTSLPQRARAQGMVLGLNRAISANSSVFGIIDDAEKIVAQIDALPDSLSDIKLQAHGTMLSRYEYLDVADGLNTHAQAMIALGRARKNSAAMLSGYSSLARSFADRLQPDSALRILNTGEKEIGATATERFKDFRDRYALIGKRANKIDAQWWINTNAKSVATPVPGKVTLVEFTAHWCGPCKNSYPGLRSLSEHLKGKDFTGVMVTQLYGYLGTQKNLTPEQEVAADREYFGKEHALPFPVAINPQIKQTGGAFVQPKPDADYRVGGIPQIMIIDKSGIIRQIVTGWDQGNTERFSRFIDQLLAEKVMN